MSFPNEDSFIAGNKKYYGAAVPITKNVTSPEFAATSSAKGDKIVAADGDSFVAGNKKYYGAAVPITKNVTSPEFAATSIAKGDKIIAGYDTFWVGAISPKKDTTS